MLRPALQLKHDTTQYSSFLELQGSFRKAASGSFLGLFLCDLLIFLCLCPSWLAAALWGEPTQTSTWELSRGKTRATPRATELVPDPPAAIPAASEATGNTNCLQWHVHLSVWHSRIYADLLWKHFQIPKARTGLSVGGMLKWQLSVYSFTLQQTEGSSVQCR